jgi:hypothetical protein
MAAPPAASTAAARGAALVQAAQRQRRDSRPPSAVSSAVSSIGGSIGGIGGRDGGISSISSSFYAGPPGAGVAPASASDAATSQRAEARRRDAGAREACSREIADLHIFFEQWFTNRGFASDSEAETTFDTFLHRFSDDFEYVTTGGRLIGKAALAGMRATRGSNPNMRIATAEHELSVLPHTAGRLVAGTYKEMQQGARNASDAAHNGTNARISTVVFEVLPPNAEAAAAAAAATGAWPPPPASAAAARSPPVRWLRLHECWLPDAEARAFDWSAAAPSSL